MRLVAMDGHRLAVFRDEAAFTCAPCIVALPKAARAAIKSVKAREFTWFSIIGQHDGIGRHEARVVDGSEGMASMEEIQAAMLDMTNPAVVWAGAVELIDGTYPEFENAIPAYVGDAGARRVQSRYLAPFVEVAQDLAGKGRSHFSAFRQSIRPCSRAMPAQGFRWSADAHARRQWRLGA